MELITLDTPVQSDSGARVFRIIMVYMNWEQAIIQIHLRENTGQKLIQASYNGQEATDLMISLNKANLAVKSLHRRIIEKLQADGILGTGTIGGIVD